MATTARSPGQVGAARAVAHELLSRLPNRWRHTAAVADRAAELAVTVDATDRDLLVAHHSGAWFVARAMGLQMFLSRSTRELSAVSDALAYADQTVGPAGERLPIRQRMAEAVRRHGSGSAQAQVHEPRRAYVLSAATRVEQRLLRVHQLAG